MNNPSIFKVEHEKIMENYRKEYVVRNVLLWLLLGIITTLTTVYFIPVSAGLRLVDYISTIVIFIIFIVVNTNLTIKFIEKNKIINMLYIVISIQLGVILKIGYNSNTFKQILMCVIISTMYFSILWIITSRIKKLIPLACFMALVIFYLLLTYFNLKNYFTIVTILSTIYYSFLFVENIEKICGTEVGRKSIMKAKLMFLFVIWGESLFLVNLV